MTLVKKFHRYADDNAGPTAPLSGRNDAIGTGAAWVDLITIPFPSWLAETDTLIAEYTVIGRFGVTREREKGSFTVNRDDADALLTVGSLQFTSTRIQVIVNGSGDVVVQVQQHATENWSFWGKVEFELVN